MKSLVLTPAVLALAAATAQPSQVFHQAVAVPAPDGALQVTLPKFDPTMGELIAIRVRLTPHITASLGMENVAREPRQCLAEVGLDVSLHYPITTRRPLVQSNTRYVVGTRLDRLDGTLDYDGPGGMTVDLDFSDPASACLGLDENDKTFFTLSRGGGRTLTLPVGITPRERRIGGYVDCNLEYRGGVEVQLWYVYSVD
jgi:hypothetical protein